MTPGNKRQAPPNPEPLAPLIDAHTHLDACGAVTDQDVRAIVDHAESVGVGRVVTVAHIPGAVHDVFLSAPAVRNRAFADIQTWLGSYL